MSAPGLAEAQQARLHSLAAPRQDRRQQERVRQGPEWPVAVPRGRLQPEPGEPEPQEPAAGWPLEPEGWPAPQVLPARLLERVVRRVQQVPRVQQVLPVQRALPVQRVLPVQLAAARPRATAGRMRGHVADRCRR